MASYSGTNYRGAITETPTSVSSMTTQVRTRLSPEPLGYSYDPRHSEGDYYDLQLVPERYTGYSGEDARRVWRAIYEENCFGLTELNLMSAKSPGMVSLPDTMIESLHEDGVNPDPHCLEKRVYYKVISGMCITNLLTHHRSPTFVRTAHINFYSYLP